MSKNSRDYKWRVEAGLSSRSHAERALDEINVRDFNATGDGSTDDRAAIIAAIDKAITRGTSFDANMQGAKIVFPPGSYKLSAPIVFTAANYGIQFIGSGRHCTTIWGNFAGYLLDKPDNGGASLNAVKGFRLRNTLLDPLAGCLRMALGANTGAGIVEDCSIQGFTGIDLSANAYGTVIRDVEGTTPWGDIPYGSCFAYTQQGHIEYSRFTRYDNGIVGHNAASEYRGLAIENCNLGIMVGAARGVACLASFSGTTMTVDAGDLYAFRGAAAATPDWYGTTTGFATGEQGAIVSGIHVGQWVYGAGIPPGTSIQSLGTGTGGSGTYTLSANVGTLSKRGVLVSPKQDQMAGCTISAIQTERCGGGIFVSAASGLKLEGIGMTGTIGPQNDVSGTPSYSAPNLTINTNALRISHFPSTFTVQLEGWATSGVTLNGTFTATKVDGDTFTINPGGNPGTINTVGNWSRECQYGIGVYTLTNGEFSALSLGGLQAEVAAIDLAVSTNPTQIGCVITGATGCTWAMPDNLNKAGWKYINCAGTNFSQVITSQRFLPGGDHGNGPVSNTNLVIGDEYIVDNVVDSALGVPAVGDTVDPTDTPDAGGNGRLCRVTRDASGWRVTAVLE